MVRPRLDGQTQDPRDTDPIKDFEFLARAPLASALMAEPSQTKARQPVSCFHVEFGPRKGSENDNQVKGLILAQNERWRRG
jgi:hypothetical protein